MTSSNCPFKCSKSNSPTDQKIRLEEYCQKNDIKVMAHFHDDHSAKTFDRPAFKRLLEFARHNKRQIDFLLFVNWSRFSRNAGDAYAMIKRLNQLGLEPQAIDQPLDFSIPENRLLLAIHLASPEVENERRSLNVTYGMRRARKSGRFTQRAPYGYVNRRDEQNKPILLPCTQNAPLIRQSFELVATGVVSTKEAWRTMRLKGLKCSKNQFHYIIRNKIYIGQIHVPAWKDEPEEWVKGIHEPLIDEALFHKVQDVLSGRSITHNRPRTSNALELPLRGLLLCQRCGSKLTGSGSRGNGGRYFYYHCQHGCRERFRAETAHESLLQLLRSIQITPPAKKLYKAVLKDLLKDSESNRSKNLISQQNSLDKLDQRLARLQDMYLDGEIDPKDYRQMKQRYEKERTQLQLELADLKSTNSDFKKHLDSAIDFLLNVENFYLKASWEIKKKILGSIFPKKLIFDGQKTRTNGLNEALALILLDIKHIQGGEKKSLVISHQRSEMVVPLGLEPRLTEPKSAVLPIRRWDIL